VLTALSVTLLLLVRAFPYFNFSALVVLSLLPVALAAEGRYADAALSFAATALLGGVLIGLQNVWIFYAAFFGWYGIVREFVLRRWGVVVKWIVSAVLFNLVLFALYFFARQLLLDIKWPAGLLIPAAEAAFVVYELLFGMCREYYMKNLRRHLYGGKAG
jgi:hypothetical protein